MSGKIELDKFAEVITTIQKELHTAYITMDNGMTRLYELQELIERIQGKILKIREKEKAIDRVVRFDLFDYIKK